MMEFFTQSFHKGELPDSERRAIVQAYEDHVQAIAPILPPSIRALATKIDLHDALIRTIVVDLGSGSLHIALRCGDLQAGDFDLDLDYSGVAIGSTLRDILSAAAEDPETEILYDEIDQKADHHLHRILFWPYREIEIEFEGLDLATLPKPDRCINKADIRYIEIENSV
jgi:hypothetical protein